MDHEIGKLAYDRWLATGNSSEDNWNWAVGRIAYRDTVTQYLQIDERVLRYAQRYLVAEIDPDAERFSVIRLKDGRNSKRIPVPFAEAFDFAPYAWSRTQHIDVGVFDGQRLVQGPDAPEQEYRFQARVAYTLGRTSAYSIALRDPSGCFKLGVRPVCEEHPEGYDGGYVWPTIVSAERYRVRYLSKTVPEWDPKDFSVYEIALRNGWAQDISKLGPDNAHHLLVDSPLVRKVDVGVNQEPTP